jgi:hypothetical protein
MTFTQPVQDANQGAAVEEELGAEFQKSVNLKECCGSETLERESQAATCESEGEQQSASLCCAGCESEPDGVADSDQKNLETSAHKVAALSGQPDPVYTSPAELPPGIRRCVELQQVVISEDPRCTVALRAQFPRNFNCTHYILSGQDLTV